ncbi:hypothetical protein EJD88_06325 [Pseudomonas sp. PB105]|uniref:Eco57I restriction-modification methylase domain-containing protein n=3 Tax=unclassified Pseudomonas TaxID=196821 RepID=UPI001DC11B6A|nr:N-6 DNA methylase [Pseudomonas sp. PB105]KAE9658206.1 hypothetical protein EJD88_06325 [Pseudomonas sp. PB105]
MAKNDITPTTAKCLDYSHRLGLEHRLKTSLSHKKNYGQFMTPPKIASYMSEKIFTTPVPHTLRILEPAIGTGVLLSALIDTLLTFNEKPIAVDVTAYETDITLKSSLTKLKKFLSRKLKAYGIKLRFQIIFSDFLLSNSKATYDLIITNPPFFKIKKDDERSIANNDVVHGQPNIYGLFMSKCADHLSPNGNACYLTPRSWTSGLYFKKLRVKIFSSLDLYAVHLFESRDAPFSKERIQQESMITWFKKSQSKTDLIALSFSLGDDDLSQRNTRTAKRIEVLPKNEDQTFVIIKNPKNFSINFFSETLLSAGIKASTGRVVPFRAQTYLKCKANKKTAPLLWMQHVQKMEIKWPLAIKHEHILNCKETTKLGIPNQNYVLVRRFSPKDSFSHIIAAPFLKNGPDLVFIENHINYISKPKGVLSSREAQGLSWYLNSTYVSDYFSERLGHTQINAGDLNKLPTPPLSVLEAIGESFENKTFKELDLAKYLTDIQFNYDQMESFACPKS